MDPVCQQDCRKWLKACSVKGGRILHLKVMLKYWIVRKSASKCCIVYFVKYMLRAGNYMNMSRWPWDFVERMFLDMIGFWILKKIALEIFCQAKYWLNVMYSIYPVYVTVSTKTCFFHISMHIGKKKPQTLKIICEITHATGKYSQWLMGPAISKGIKSTKTIHHLTRLAMGVWKYLFRFRSLNGECLT